MDPWNPMGMEMEQGSASQNAPHAGCHSLVDCHGMRSSQHAHAFARWYANCEVLVARQMLLKDGGVVP